MEAHTITRLHVADYLLPPGSPTPGEKSVVYAFVVRHGVGTLLFDTGMAKGIPEIDSLFQTIEYPILPQLERLGFSARDITMVINCHLHFDHCGHNRLFPHARFFAQTSEYRAAFEPDYTVREAFDFPGAEFQLLEGEFEILPGIRIVPTPGHTVGHQSLVVEADQGLTILAGQAVRSPREWMDPVAGDPNGLPTAWDRDAYMTSITLLKGFRPRVVHFSHDSEPWLEFSP